MKLQNESAPVVPIIEAAPAVMPNPEQASATTLNNELVQNIDRQLSSGEAVNASLLASVATRLEERAERDEQGNILRYRGDDFFDEKRNVTRHAPVSQKTARAIVAAHQAMQTNPEDQSAWKRAAEHEHVLSASAKNSLTPSLAQAVKIARGETTLAAVVAERRVAHDAALQELLIKQQAEQSSSTDEEERNTKANKASVRAKEGENADNTSTAGEKAALRANAAAKDIVEASANPNANIEGIIKTLAANPEAIKALTTRQHTQLVTRIAHRAEANELRGISPKDIKDATVALDGFINANETLNRHANAVLGEAFDAILSKLATDFGDEFVAAYMASSTLDRFDGTRRAARTRVTLYAGDAAASNGQPALV